MALRWRMDHTFVGKTDGSRGTRRAESDATIKMGQRAGANW